MLPRITVQPEPGGPTVAPGARVANGHAGSRDFEAPVLERRRTHRPRQTRHQCKQPCHYTYLLHETSAFAVVVGQKTIDHSRLAGTFLRTQIELVFSAGSKPAWVAGLGAADDH
jgi:hypothetical protein